jgi:hypothetical protein
MDDVVVWSYWPGICTLKDELTDVEVVVVEPRYRSGTRLLDALDELTAVELELQDWTMLLLVMFSYCGGMAEDDDTARALFDASE